MFLKITKKVYNGKIYKQASIVESVREDGVLKQVLIRNLGSINTKEEMNRAKQLCESLKKGKQLVTVQEISDKRTLEFGVLYTIQELWKKYNITKELSNALGSQQELIFYMTAARLYDPTSDLSTAEWINNSTTHTDIREQHLYRALDYLIKQKEIIEKEIFKQLKDKLKLNTDTVYYDLTSSYFEGSNCEIAMFGYSRDNRPDRKQIVIALAMIDGIPVMHEVFEGNTADKSTLMTIGTAIKNRLNIREVVFVADRGLITTDNIGNLDKLDYKYILASKRRNDNKIKELMVKPIISPNEQHAEEVAKSGERRYILCINNKTQKEHLVKLESIKNGIEKKLEELTKSRKMSRDSTMQKALKILGKNRRLFNIKYENEFKYLLNKEVYDYEKKIAGKFLLITNTKLNVIEVMKKYKELAKIETAFKELKHFVEIRPIYHWKERRVKAHIFVCVLAFLTETLIERATNLSARKAIRILKRIRISQHNINEERVNIIDKLLQDEISLFNELQIDIPQRIF